MLSENIKHISSEDIHDFKIEKTVIDREEIPHYKRTYDFYNNTKVTATADQAVKWNKCEKLSNFRVTTPEEYKTMLNYMSEHEICNDPKMKHFIAPFPFNIPIKSIADRSPSLDDMLWTFSSIFLAFKLNLIDGVYIFRNNDWRIKKINPIIVVNKTKRKEVRTYFEKLFAPIDRIYESGHFDSTFKYTLYFRRKGRPLLRSTKTFEEHEEWYKNFKTTKELIKLINPNFFISEHRQEIEKMTKPALVKLLTKSNYYSITPNLYLWDRYGMPFEFETIEEVNKFKDKLIKEILGKIYNDTDLSRCVASFSIGVTNLKFETELQKINSLTSSLFV